MTDIEVYSGWSDAGRYQQAYTIEYSLATAPTTFLTLTTVSPYPSDAFTNNDQRKGAMTELTSTSSQYLAGGKGIAEIKIVFNDTDALWTGYRELVVNGTVLPEPSTYALLAFGAAGLVILVRRRSQATR